MRRVPVARSEGRPRGDAFDRDARSGRRCWRRPTPPPTTGPRRTGSPPRCTSVRATRQVIPVPRLPEASPEPIHLKTRDPSELDIDESVLFAPRHDPLRILIQSVVEVAVARDVVVDTEDVGELGFVREKPKLFGEARDGAQGSVHRMAAVDLPGQQVEGQPSTDRCRTRRPARAPRSRTSDRRLR